MIAQRRFSRRAFTKTAATGIAAAASGVVLNPEKLFAAMGKGTADDFRAGEVIDTNVTLGQWPFRRVPLDDAAALTKKLRRQKVVQAWAGSFEGLFHKDIAAANARLAEECRRRGRKFFIPFGTINPAQTGWEDDLRRCVEVHRMRGIRLYPGYHNYRVDDSAFARLLELARTEQLVVQIVADMEDERTQHLIRVPHPDFRPLPALLKAQRGSRVVLLNWFRSINAPLVRELAAAGAIFDIATLEGVEGVAQLIRRISERNVVFGSHAPLFYFESAELKLKESALSREQELAVCLKNAQRLLSRS